MPITDAAGGESWRAWAVTVARNGTTPASAGYKVSAIMVFSPTDDVAAIAGLEGGGNAVHSLQFAAATGFSLGVVPADDSEFIGVYWDGAAYTIKNAHTGARTLTIIEFAGA